MSNGRYNISISSDAKEEAQHLARSLGLTFSAVVEQQLRNFVREQKVLFDATHPPLQQGENLRYAQERYQQISREFGERKLRHDSLARKMKHTRRTIMQNCEKRNKRDVIG